MAEHSLDPLDVLYRLRSRASALRGQLSPNNPFPPGQQFGAKDMTDTAELLDAAADEIERLRQAAQVSD